VLRVLNVHNPFTLAGPNQSYDPSDQTPSQKEVDEKDGKFVVSFAKQGDKCGQEIEDEPKFEERKQEEPKDVHRDLLAMVTSAAGCRFPSIIRFQEIRDWKPQGRVILREPSGSRSKQTRTFERPLPLPPLLRAIARESLAALKHIPMHFRGQR
jgi:hypothetical protein